tara:strand:+ start:2087 stop:2692 length:606 start_codon:yes stop_codon:yes gene_type:complete
MHNYKVLILGPPSFINTIDELKPFLKFIPFSNDFKKDCDLILFHKEALKHKEQKDFISNCSSIKICASNDKEFSNYCDTHLELPTSIKELNTIVEKLTAKKKFSKNSSIEVKNYLLNKNEKRLTKENKSIILTEKEIQLLELLLESKDPISKNNILSSVWNYSADADTHTVETHIYRLRKKISEKFTDEKFILNNKEGYYL